MFLRTLRPCAGACTCLVVLVGPAGPAYAQLADSRAAFLVGHAAGYGTAVQGDALSQTAPYAAGPNLADTSAARTDYAAGYGALVPSASLPGAGGYGTWVGAGSYAGSGGYSPAGGSYPGRNAYASFLTAAGRLTTAEARAQHTLQQARLAREQAGASALETRHKAVETAAEDRRAWLARHDPEVVRRGEQADGLERARNDPPLTEILSAKAMNALLTDLITRQGRGERGPTVPLAEEVVRGVNLTGQGTRANPGLLKGDGRLQWPACLEGPGHAACRDRLGGLLVEAVGRVRQGDAVPASYLKDLRAELGKMNAVLRSGAGELSPSQYVEARRYLGLVDDAIKALEHPSAARYLCPNEAPPRNVAALVRYMADRGLVFAPAVPGDTVAYRALYHALQAFEAGLRTPADGDGNP
jgi:hypothetical protein